MRRGRDKAVTVCSLSKLQCCLPAVHQPMHIALTFFGPFEATCDGRPMVFPTNAARALFAYLAAEADERHARTALTGLLWPDQMQASAFTNLRQTLSRIRKAVPEPPGIGAVMDISRHTVELHSDAVVSDLRRFEQLLREVSAHKHAGNDPCAECVRRLKEAVSLCNGEFLHGLFLEHSEPFEEWLLLKREQLQRQLVDALTDLTHCAEATGDYTAMADYARRQLVIDPWREEAHGHLMRALAFSGQRSAALAQYAACAKVLREALGIGPSVELNALHERIRSGELAPVALTAPTPAHNLPSQLAAFVGREEELATLAVQLQAPNPEARLITLTGMGGIGKTRLAIEAARMALDAFPDGAYFVPLAALKTAVEIEPSIAVAMGLPPSRGNVHTALMAALRNKRVLLVLDNFEQLLGGKDNGAAVVVKLLEAAPGVRMLATSRERLNVRGEHVFQVSGMSTSGDSLTEVANAPSARLFVQRAHLSDPGFRLTEDNAPTVARICRWVQGLPLALELAAAWVGSMSLNDIAHEIERSADFLAYDWHDAPERQRSVRAVFDWSWHLLTSDEQQTLRRLSVFSGGFTREAAQMVADASWHTLTRLQHKSLLARGDGGRYTMHELVLQFAAARLADHPSEQAQTEARHSAHFLQFAAAREQRLARNQPREATLEIQTELDNVRRAWAWAAANDAHQPALVQSAYALWQFCGMTGQLAEGRAALESALRHLEQTLPPASDPSAAERREALGKLAGLWALALVHSSHYDQAIRTAEQALALAQEGYSVASREAEATALFALAQAAKWQGQLQSAYTYLTDMLDVVAHSRIQTELLHDMHWGVHLWLAHVGGDVRGDPGFGREQLLEALRICRSLNKVLGEMICLINLADVSRISGDAEHARANYEHALPLTREMGYRWGEAATQSELGDTLRQLGQYEQACVFLENAITIFGETGDLNYQAYAAAFLGRVRVLMGDFAGAAEWLDFVLRLVKDSPSAEIEAFGLQSHALLCQVRGDEDGALVYAQRACAIALASTGESQQAHALTMLGHAQYRLGLIDDAAHSYTQALDRFTHLGHAHLAAEPQAGLAQIALLQNDLPQAMAQVSGLLALLAERDNVGINEPFPIYVACVRVLHAAGDGRWVDVMHAAQALLHQRADAIHDPALRRSYLHNVDAHHALQTEVFEFRTGGR